MTISLMAIRLTTLSRRGALHAATKWCDSDHSAGLSAHNPASAPSAPMQGCDSQCSACFGKSNFPQKGQALCQPAHQRLPDWLAFQTRWRNAPKQIVSPSQHMEPTMTFMVCTTGCLRNSLFACDRRQGRCGKVRFHHHGQG